MGVMRASRGRTLRVGLLLLASGGCVSSAHAADVPFFIGGLYAHGNSTNVYGVQAVWAPREGNEFLAPHDLGFRVAAQVQRWVASDGDSPYHSLADGSVIAELRYWLAPEAPVRPFAEGGLGVHLLSNVRVGNRQLGVAFDFGSQVAVGAVFGDNGRYELAAFAHHVSNAGIKDPNDGINYFGIRFRAAVLP